MQVLPNLAALARMVEFMGNPQNPNVKWMIPGLVNIQKTMENIGKSPSLIGQSTISMGYFQNLYIKLPEGN
jgi:hypothetical protein